MSRKAIAGAVVVIGLATATVAVVQVAHPFGIGARPVASSDERKPPAPVGLAPVVRRQLTAKTNLDGTLGYAGSYSVINKAQGTLTRLPPVGRIMTQGRPLYWVDGRPVVLLYGREPVHRTLKVYDEGTDVRQLNIALDALGYGDAVGLDPTSDEFDWRTRYAVRKLQKDLEVKQTGQLALGDAVFVPSALRIAKVSTTSGSTTTPGTPIIRATTRTRHVVVPLEASRRSQVSKGDKVEVILPDGRTTPGVVSSVGTTTTKNAKGVLVVQVTVRPTRPKDVPGGEAPVQVRITTQAVKNTLAVPVNALLALADGGYAVEVAAGRKRHLVPVKLGLFDESSGLVQVTSSGLAEGQRVVVPAV